MKFFKNDNRRHAWGYTGKIEGAEYPRAEVQCKICSEVRLIAVSLDSPGLQYGCFRTAWVDRLIPGDLLAVEYSVSGHSGRRLDRFEGFSQDGTGALITSNLGGGRYRVEPGTWYRA